MLARMMCKLLPLFSTLLVFAVASEASACGSVTQHFRVMSRETDAQKLDAFLDRYSCVPTVAYAPDSADTYIALVLINASRARVSKDKVASVLATFNCASLARALPGYVEIAAYIGVERFASACDPEVLSRIYIVVADGGANLRREPALSASKIGAIAEGIAVRDGKRQGDWVLVDTYLGAGYMHISTLKSYLGDT